MRKSNVCLCTLVVPQLLGVGLEGCGWSNRRCWIPCSTAGSPASPLGHFWSLPISQLNMPAQQKTSSSSSAYWSPTTEGAESALERGSAGQGGWVNLTHTHTPSSSHEPPPAVPWNHTPRKIYKHLVKGHIPSFKHIVIQINSTEGGKENTQRTKGQRVRIKPSPLIPGQMAYP